MGFKGPWFVSVGFIVDYVIMLALSMQAGEQACKGYIGRCKYVAMMEVEV